VGPAATAGLSYRITDRWHLHGSYSFSRVKTDLTADTDGVIRTSRISFAPQALVISIGYSFGR
jgi:outer membrane protein W